MIRWESEPAGCQGPRRRRSARTKPFAISIKSIVAKHGPRMKAQKSYEMLKQSAHGAMAWIYIDVICA